MSDSTQYTYTTEFALVRTPFRIHAITRNNYVSAELF